MTFSIEFLDEPVLDLQRGEKASYGLITIGKFQERFQASLDFWDIADYQNHWRQAIEKILRFSPLSCLITSMVDPATANFITWWPIYRVDKTLRIQNQVLFLEELSKPFDPNNPFSFVPKRETINEEGEKISEWSVPLVDVRAFYIRKFGALDSAKS